MTRSSSCRVSFPVEKVEEQPGLRHRSRPCFFHLFFDSQVLARLTHGHMARGIAWLGRIHPGFASERKKAPNLGACSYFRVLVLTLASSVGLITYTQKC